jgi:hypothetical protein
VNPITRLIPAEAQVDKPMASQPIHMAPVKSAVATNHSPRMNCFGVTPHETSTIQRPAVGAMIARARAPSTGIPASTPFWAPTIAESAEPNCSTRFA